MLSLPPDAPIATAEELAAVWPGGAQNAYRGHDAWIQCYAQLTGFARRVEFRAQQRTQAISGEELERAVRMAASRQPIGVTLSIGVKYVQQKSAWTLFFLDTLDAIVRPLAELALELQDADPEDLRGLIPITRGLAWRTWAWILLTAGVGLPFAEGQDATPPDWTEQLLPQDFVAIYAAHHQLHYESARIMNAAFPREPGETSRLSLTGFLAGYAAEHGTQPSEIFRGWGLPEALAAAVASSENHRVAKRNADAKRGPG